MSGLNIKQLKKQAKELLKHHRSGCAESSLRIGKHQFAFKNDKELICSRTYALNDAQHAIARENGFFSWKKLIQSTDADSRMDLFCLRDIDPNWIAETSEAPIRFAFVKEYQLNGCYSDAVERNKLLVTEYIQPESRQVMKRVYYEPYSGLYSEDDWQNGFPLHRIWRNKKDGPVISKAIYGCDLPGMPVYNWQTPFIFENGVCASSGTPTSEGKMIHTIFYKSGQPCWEYQTDRNRETTKLWDEKGEPIIDMTKL